MAFAQHVVAGLLACLLGLTKARLSESIVIATSSSNDPPFSLLCSIHYNCIDQFRKLVSVQSVNVELNLPNSRAGKCTLSQRSDIGYQAEIFLNACGNPDSQDRKQTLKNNCLANASGGVEITYNCESAAITATTPVTGVTGDDVVGISTQQQGGDVVGISTQQQGGESSSQTTVGTIAAAVVLSVAACSTAGMVLVCWRSGLVCFAAGKSPAAPSPPAGGARISGTEQHPVDRLHYASTLLVQQEQQQHVQWPAGNHQQPLIAAEAPSPPAVVRYFSLIEQENHCYEALPDVQDASLSANDQEAIYDEPAVSSPPVPPSPERPSALPQTADTNYYFTIEPPAANETGGGHPSCP